MKLKDTIEKDEALKATALKVYQQYPTIMGQHHMGKHAEKNALGLLSLIDVPAVARPAIKKISNRIEFNFDSAEDFPGIKPTTNNTTAKKPPSRKQTSWAKAVTATDTTSLASEPSDTERTVYSTRTGITTSDQQTMQSEAISVLTEYIQTARREDAALRKEERKEDEQRRKEDREERKLEKQEAAKLRKEEAAERRLESKQRDEYNLKMFLTMMETMMHNNNNTNNNVDETDSNKKRKNTGLALDEPVHSEEQETNNMELDNDTTNRTKKNHDPQLDDSPTISH